MVPTGKGSRVVLTRDKANLFAIKTSQGSGDLTGVDCGAGIVLMHQRVWFVHLDESPESQIELHLPDGSIDLSDGVGTALVYLSDLSNNERAIVIDAVWKRGYPNLFGLSELIKPGDSDTGVWISDVNPYYLREGIKFPLLRDKEGHFVLKMSPVPRPKEHYKKINHLPASKVVRFDIKEPKLSHGDVFSAVFLHESLGGELAIEISIGRIIDFKESKDDPSRVTSIGESQYDDFTYEAYWYLNDSKRNSKHYILGPVDLEQYPARSVLYVMKSKDLVVNEQKRVRLTAKCEKYLTKLKAQYWKQHKKDMAYQAPIEPNGGNTNVTGEGGSSGDPNDNPPSGQVEVQFDSLREFNFGVPRESAPDHIDILAELNQSRTHHFVRDKNKPLTPNWPDSLLRTKQQKIDYYNYLHELLIHPSPGQLFAMVRRGVGFNPLVLEVEKYVNELQPCWLVKMGWCKHKGPKSRNDLLKTGSPNIVALDIKGPVTPPDLHGNRFIHQYKKTDGMICAFYSKEHTGKELVKGFKNLRPLLGVISGYIGDGEMIKGEFSEYMAKNGVPMVCSPPYTPVQIQFVESTHYILMVLTAILLHSVGLSMKFWSQAHKHSCLMMSIRADKRLGIVPLESNLMRKLDLRYLYIFGTPVVVLKTPLFTGAESTFTLRGYYGILTTPELNCPAGTYNIYVKDKFGKERIIQSNDFSPGKIKFETSTTKLPQNLIDMIETITGRTMEVELMEKVSQYKPGTCMFVRLADGPDPSCQKKQQVMVNAIKASKLEHINNLKYFEYSETLKRPPQDFAEAVTRPDWEAPMRKEVSGFNQRKTCKPYYKWQWDLLTKDQQSKMMKSVIGVKVIFDIKRDGSYKVRATGMGNQLQFKMKLNNTASPTMREITFKLLIALSVHYGLIMEIWDVCLAFLYGSVREKVYLKPHDLFKQYGMQFEDGTDPDWSNIKFLELIHGLYGVQDAGKSWIRFITDILVEELGYTRLITDTCVFVKAGSDTLDVIGLHVDDGTTIGTRTSIDALVTALRGRVTLKHVSDNLFDYLAMDIEKTDSGIKLSQAAYIERIAKKYLTEDELKAASRVDVPLPAGLKLDLCLDKSLTARLQVLDFYRELNGAALFAARMSRPDVLHCIIYLTQYAHAHDELHIKYAKQIIQYLYNTRHFYLKCEKQEGNFIDCIKTFADSEFAGDPSRRTDAGFLLLYGSFPICTVSKRLSEIMRSVHDTEFAIGTDAACEQKYVRQFLGELGITSENPMELYMDNQAAIHTAESGIVGNKSKYIDVNSQLLCQLVEKGLTTVKKIDGTENPADLMTKRGTRKNLRHLRPMFIFEH